MQDLQKESSKGSRILQKLSPPFYKFLKGGLLT
jgi:hypothetical protein